jgi:hypothetical protein
LPSAAGGEAASLLARGADISIPREVWAAAREHQAAATGLSSAEVLLTDWFGGGSLAGLPRQT